MNAAEEKPHIPLTPPPEQCDRPNDGPHSQPPQSPISGWAAGRPGAQRMIEQQLRQDSAGAGMNLSRAVARSMAVSAVIGSAARSRGIQTAASSALEAGPAAPTTSRASSQSRAIICSGRRGIPPASAGTEVSGGRG